MSDVRVVQGEAANRRFSARTAASQQRNPSLGLEFLFPRQPFRERQSSTICPALALAGLELLHELPDGQLVQLSIFRMLAQPILNVFF